VTSLFVELVEDAVAAGRLDDVEPEEAAYLLASLNSAFVISLTLGNDFGVRIPDVLVLTRFCLGGLGASLEDGWQERLSASIRMPPKRKPSTPVKRSSSRPARPTARRAAS
jgi:hypothetical protein